jgi:hypothetical protein
VERERLFKKNYMIFDFLNYFLNFLFNFCVDQKNILPKNYAAMHALRYLSITLRIATENSRNVLQFNRRVSS